MHQISLTYFGFGLESLRNSPKQLISLEQFKNESNSNLAEVGGEMAHKWTVMVYMAGDNDLDSNGISDLREMKRVGSNQDVAIIAQFDRAGNARHTKRYYVRNYDISPSIKSDEVADLGETNTGSAKELTEFIKWGMEKFTAEYYLVIIWAHGTGAYDENIYYADARTLRPNLKRHGVFLSSMGPSSERLGIDFNKVDVIGKDDEKVYTLIAPDDESKDFLDNVELKRALKAVGKDIDILGMDACLMSMAEVCYQVRETVKITVASEAQEDVEGWPYELFLSRLVNNPDMKPAELAKTIVEQFIVLYSDVENAATGLTACELSRVDTLAEAVDSLAARMLEDIGDDDVLDTLMLSRFRAWSDELVQSVDLYDFCQLLRRRSNQDEIRKACKQVMDVITDPKFVLKNMTLGNAMKYSNGVGIYFPVKYVSPLYKRLDFVGPDATRWGTFIKQYVEAAARS